MSADADIHSALMAQVEVMVAALGYPVLWPQKGGDKPAGEHIAVSHLPNDDDPLDVDREVYERKGFLILTLVSPLGEYEAFTRRKAAEIADYFSRGRVFGAGSASVTIKSRTTRQGREVSDRWETPIWVNYWSIT